MNLYTIGHSNHPIELFLHLLQGAKVTCLVDVRSRPFSRFSPQFNQARLQATLADHQVEYIYLGEALGGRPSDPTCYRHQIIPKNNQDYIHELMYEAVMQRPWFIAGITHLLELAEGRTTAIMCSEEDPARCHRHLLIARYLLAIHPEVNILHIRKDGSLLPALSMPKPAADEDGDQLSFQTG